MSEQHEQFREEFRHELNSRWTTEQLRELIESVNVERDRRYADRFSFLEEKIAAGFIAAKDAVAAALVAAKELVANSFDASKQAIAKAETATEKRFEGVNEFRAQLKDQQATFLPRAEAESRLQQLRDITDGIVKQVTALQLGESKGAGADAATQAARANANRITALIIATVLSLLGLAGTWAFMLFKLFGK